MALRNLPNDQLFEQYDSDLVLRLHNPRNLSDTRRMLLRFRDHLGGMPPSAQTAKGFLAQFAAKKPRTLYRYAQMIKAFMKWYGDPITDLKVKVPKTLPPYVEDEEVSKLIEALGNKKTHKRIIERDTLLVLVAKKTGMRRSELADLEAGQVHGDFIEVRDGKGGKDRIIPLGPKLGARLHKFTASMRPDEKVFKLAAPSITMKIKDFARRAGVGYLHAHSLRHKFATDLVEREPTSRLSRSCSAMRTWPLRRSIWP